MNINPSRFTPNRQIVSEACAWFIETRAGDLDASARDRFSHWLRRSPENIQAYLEVASAWAELPADDPQGRIDIQALIARARTDANVVVLERPGKDSDRSRLKLSRQRLAASIVLLLTAAGLVTWFGVHRDGTYKTEIGEQRFITLADGSSVELNARSRFRIHFDEQLRNVYLLEGQALFHVTKNPQRPFIVHSGAARVRAVGTEFDVYRKRSGTIVTVLEGQVAVLTAPRSSAPLVAEERAPTLLSAGEQVVVTAQSVAKPKRADTAAATAWVHKRLMFEETPLAEVAEEFNRYNKRALNIADPQLQRLAISGVYSSIDPASLIRFLRDQPTIHVNESDTEITVTRETSH